jgi:hypothetical protein
VCPVMRFPAGRAAAYFWPDERSKEKGLDSPSVAAVDSETLSQSSAVETGTPPRSISRVFPGIL